MILERIVESGGEEKSDFAIDLADLGLANNPHIAFPTNSGRKYINYTWEGGGAGGRGGGLTNPRNLGIT
jgi:hypothetical protein